MGYENWSAFVSKVFGIGLMRFSVTVLSAVLFCNSVAAQSAVPCDARAHPDAIVEPWSDHTRTFAEGAVRVALLDTIEPAAAAYYLMILHPPYDEVGQRRCTLIGQNNGAGYQFFYFDDLYATYDPAQGLVLQIPAIIHLPDQNFQNSAYLYMSVNQATGDVAVKQQFGSE